MSSNHSTSYLEGMDGLRALAALGVFCVHLNQVLDADLYWGPFDLGLTMANGEVGVALFFVLSGFLLGRPFIVYRMAGGVRPSLRRYWLHRLVRIVPAYYLGLLLLVGLAGTWRTPEGLTDLGLHLLFVFNLVEFSTLSINPVFWTLAVEMQFYLLLPLLLLLPGRLITWLLAVGAAAYGLHVWLNHLVDVPVAWPGSQWRLWLRPNGAVLTHSLFAHLPHFLLGIFAALLSARGWLAGIGSRSASVAFVVIGVSLLLLLSTSWLDGLVLPFGRYYLPIVPLLLALLVMLTPHTGRPRRLLEGVPLRYLGRISYGLYLYHLPLIWLVDQQMRQHGWDAQDSPWWFTLITLSLSLIAAAVSFHLLERPLLRWVRRGDQSPSV